MSLMPAHPSPASADVEVLVIGAGQAGLALGFHLRKRGVDVLLVDAAPAPGHSWRTRWDSLRLFTPAQYDGLPGLPFPGADGTYPSKDDVADYLARYARTFELPLRLRTRVDRLSPMGRIFAARTSVIGDDGTERPGVVTARRVVVATGPFQRPVVPTISAGFGADVQQVHSSAYRHPGSLPGETDGTVLVVGSGNSGLQIALELAATRDVVLAQGSRALMLPQRLLGRDLFWWLTRTGALTKSADSPVARRMRERGDLVIGTRWADLLRAGVDVRPRLTGAQGSLATFADGSARPVSTVLWATGFRPDVDWLDVPGAVRDGRIVQDQGVTPVAGLYTIGQPWQSTRGSALLGFVQRDAERLGELLAAQAGSTASAASSVREVMPSFE